MLTDLSAVKLLEAVKPILAGSFFINIVNAFIFYLIKNLSGNYFLLQVKISFVQVHAVSLKTCHSCFVYSM